MSSDNGTRPRTGVQTPWSIQEEVDEWDEDDDDPGLFSFLPPPPGTSGNAPTTALSHGGSAPGSQATSGVLAIEPPPVLQTPPSSSHGRPALGLSPAASYAAKMQDGGTRKRGSWAYPESPSYAAHNPLDRPSKDYIVGYDLGRSDNSKLSDTSASTAWDKGEDIAMHDLIDGRKTETSRNNTARTKATTEKLPYYGDGIADEEDSPYAEVRASVSNLDDPEMPCLTFRSWFLGLFFSVVFGATNMFFNFRYPAPIIYPIVVQVASYPLGKLLALTLPTTEWGVPTPLRVFGFGETCSFNPGPFNIKEHSVILLMTNTAMSPGNSLNFSVVIRLYYDINLGVWFDLLLLLSTQLVGFGVAGLARRFVVWPANLIWPVNLVYCTLLNTLHAEEDDDDEKGGISRYKFFLYAFGGGFFWYFLPGFLFQALSAFSFICWAAPNNIVVNQLFGVYSGLGMGLLTFDWSQIAYIGSPLITPWWAEVNVFVGFFVAYWIIAPIMYYRNVWFTSYLPMSTPAIYDRFGLPYNTSRVIDPLTSTLDQTAYDGYSPVYLPVTYATVYCLALALSTACIVHTGLYHGRDIWTQLKRRTRLEDEDVHAKLMRNYPEVPDLWYLGMLVAFVGVSMGVCGGWDSHLPIWSLLVSLLIGFIYILPGAYIFAMTGQQININLIVELIGGYIMPQNAVGNMLFKIYGTQSFGLGLAFIQDLKLGHYMKIPPRVTFVSQVVATVASCVAQLGVTQWLLGSVKDFCTDHQTALLSCPFVRVFKSSGVIWGLIGPLRQFGIGTMYNPILWSFLIGAALPVCFWMLERRWPKTWLSSVNIPVLLTGGMYVPPATGINYSSWFFVGFIFQYWMRRHFFPWWSKYNFVLSAALDSSTAISGLFIFLTLQLPKGGTIALSWWGNNVFTETADWNGTPYLTVPDSGFGPATW